MGSRVFVTVYHVAAGLGALQDAGGLGGHVSGPTTMLVLGPAASNGEWLTPSNLQPDSGISLFGASVRADAARTLAAIGMPQPIQGWSAEEVDHVDLFTDIAVLGTPNPLTLGVATPFIQKVFAVCGGGNPRVDVLNMRGTAGRVTGPPGAQGHFTHTANTEDGMSGAGVFRAQDGALLGLNTRALPAANEAVAIVNALPLLE